ncbi:hypothetical protein [Streptosporangium sp. NPDC087985]|uniref:hypothetical protein n=1 Tax=Streptosporangium sp. NPDC087985 TaxID=3366196 RepID=UPI0037FB6438
MTTKVVRRAYTRRGTVPLFSRRRDYQYIDKVIDAYELLPDKFLAVDSGEHRFAVPLDVGSRKGPEAAHLVIPEDAAEGRQHALWIW